MTDIISGLAIGKTVDIVYLRDGETKNTKLTTISQQESERLEEAFAAQAGRRGLFWLRSWRRRSRRDSQYKAVRREA